MERITAENRTSWKKIQTHDRHRFITDKILWNIRNFSMCNKLNC